MHLLLNSPKYFFELIIDLNIDLFTVVNQMFKKFQSPAWIAVALKETKQNGIALKDLFSTLVTSTIRVIFYVHLAGEYVSGFCLVKCAFSLLYF